MDRFGPSIDAPWLAVHLHDPGLRIIDFRCGCASRGRGKPRPYDPGRRIPAVPAC
jgi:hypothetical protein